MKTEEDEAFDDLARKQGAWGGGYQAKRQAAMDKINSHFDAAYKKMHEDRAMYGTSWSKDGERIDPASVYLEQPAQEPVARVRFSGEEIVWLIDEPIESNTLLYTAPPKRPWVGLTDEERNKILMSHKPSWERHIAEEIEAKLKEKNFD